MSAKHTPGPWAYRPSNSGHFIAGTGANSGYLAEIRHCRTSQDVRADAHLIAAAPDLLEACKQALAELDDCLAVPGDEWDFYDKLRAAIAKATGEAA